MKCTQCGSEWRVNPGLSQSVLHCPFCGEPLLAQKSEYSTVEDVLQEIKLRFGFEFFMDGKKLVAIFSDLAPKLSKQHRLLEDFVACGGHEKIIGVKTSAESEQMMCINQIVRQMREDMYIDDTISRKLCESFLFVIAGKRLPVSTKHTEWNSDETLEMQDNASKEALLLKIKALQEEVDRLQGIVQSSANGNYQLSQTHKKPLTVGEVIALGSYSFEQGNIEEPIKWTVLSVEKNKALILCMSALIRMPFNDVSRGVLTWESSTIRKWLNNTFVTTAFSQREQQSILVTNVDNSKEQGYSKWNTFGGSNTQDKVFLLSYAEANQFFSISYFAPSQKARFQANEYGLRSETKVSSEKNSEQRTRYESWWLRSPGYQQNYIMFIDHNGILMNNLPDKRDICVRPAMWISIDSLNNIYQR